MGGLLAGISGASGAASNSQGYSDAAGGQSAAAFAAALKQAAGNFSGAEGQIQDSARNVADKDYIHGVEDQYAPQFKAENQQLSAKDSAMGILNSGAGKADFSDLAGQQSSTLANAISPLYQGILSQYDSTVGNSAATQAGIAGQGAQAQTNIYGQGAASANSAYNDQLGQFDSALGTAASAAGA